MKYKVLKDVMIDGVFNAAGSTVEINHDKTDRLVMLGFIEKAKTRKKRQTKVIKPMFQESDVDA